jgi:DNA repair photolyase
MRTDLRGKSIYMSSVTDPYQPVERRLGLVRDLLVELVTRQPKLVVQTRGPLVTRDIDLLSQFDDVRVNMTVTTDSEQVRRAFEPTCPSNSQRLDAIRQVQEAGIQTCITMTPLLPIENPQEFARQLLATGVRRFVVQPFHASSGRFVAGTRDAAVEMSKHLNWDEDRYRATVEVLRERAPSPRRGTGRIRAMTDDKLSEAIVSAICAAVDRVGDGPDGGWTAFEHGSCITDLAGLSGGEDCYYDRPAIGLQYALWYHPSRTADLVRLLLPLIAAKGRAQRPLHLIDLGAGTGATATAARIALERLRVGRRSDSEGAP